MTIYIYINIYITDEKCTAPLSETVWETLDTIPSKDFPPRTLGPPTTVTGTGFFEYFLPLMAILGDIIVVHHRRFHPRLGIVDDAHAIAIISDLLASCEASIDKLRLEIDGPDKGGLAHNGPQLRALELSTPCKRARDRSRLQLVTAYSTHILHVLHVLLHGKWDAISMLDDDDDWITSRRFNECASHAIAASHAVSSILDFDPELTFMPYLFGIYLLHGSFILLLFADRMPQLGANQSVELACETIVRAHEVCVVTLSTEFQVCSLCRSWPGKASLERLARSGSKFPGADKPWYRKTFARFCDRHCIVCVGRVRQNGRSIRREGERYRCIDGQKAQKGWLCDVTAASWVLTLGR